MQVKLILILVIALAISTIAGASAQTNGNASAALHRLVAGYDSRASLVISGTAIVGHGSSERTGTATINLDVAGNARLLITIGDEHLSEIFAFRGGEPTCTTTSSSNPRTAQIENACGTPVPWFSPLPFLSRLPAASVSTTATATPAGEAFTISHADRIQGAAAIRSRAWPSTLVFDSTGTLTQYTYPISLHRDSLKPLYVQITYSNYQMFGSVRFPSHIHQFVDGYSTFDLTITSVSEVTQ
jgi:hypothetical protein